MKNFINVIFAASIVLTSCDNQGDLSVATAEDEYSSGRLQTAQAICDSLVLGSRFSDLSVDELCRLSLLTSRIAEQTDEDTNMALAAKCMQAAMNRNADSVMTFVHSLPADEQSRTLFVRQITQMIGNSCDPDTGEIVITAEPDSFPNYTD